MPMTAPFAGMLKVAVGAEALEAATADGVADGIPVME